MLTLKKCLIFSMAEASGILMVLLMFGTIRHRHHRGRCENAGAGIDERLNESKSVLEKAAAHLQSAFEHLKSLKH